jgi:NADH-quinone oxidoreductase subunit C
MSAPWVLGLPASCRAECSGDACGMDWVLEMQPGHLLPAVSELWDRGYFLEDVTCTDLLEGFQLIYHFDHWDEPGRITLKLFTSHDSPKAPSITGVYAGALWHERECFDLFGIRFEGHPDLKPLLLPDDLTLRPLVKEPARRRSVYEIIPFCQMVDCGTGQARESGKAFEPRREARGEGGE